MPRVKNITSARSSSAISNLMIFCPQGPDAMRTQGVGQRPHLHSPAKGWGSSSEIHEKNLEVSENGRNSRAFPKSLQCQCYLIDSNEDIPILRQKCTAKLRGKVERK